MLRMSSSLIWQLVESSALLGVMQQRPTIRKLSLAALAKDTKLKCGKAGKRIAAATDPDYRKSLLNLIF